MEVDKRRAKDELPPENQCHPAVWENRGVLLSLAERDGVAGEYARQLLVTGGKSNGFENIEKKRRYLYSKLTAENEAEEPTGGLPWE